MVYNLELFGKKLKEIRQALKLNQKWIAKATIIDDSTIRRIENGKVLPKLDTLEILSPIYKVDLVALLLECRFDDYSTFCEIRNKLELKLDNRELIYNEVKDIPHFLKGGFQLIKQVASLNLPPRCGNVMSCYTRLPILK